MKSKKNGYLIPQIAMVCLAIAGMGSGFAFAVDPVPGPIVLGTLKLDLGNANAWVYGTTTQALATDSKGVLKYTSPPLAVIGPVGSASFLNKSGKKWIGTGTNGLFIGRNQAGGPKLYIVLAAAAVTPPPQITPPFWSQMRLQFNMKHNAVVQMDLSNAGAGSAPYFLYSGLSINDQTGRYFPPYDPLNDHHRKCAGGSDSSPDSDAVNCTLDPIIDEDADTVLFTTLAGDWSLGGSGSLSTFTFEKATTNPPLDCNETVEVQGDDLRPSAQCTRLPNGPSTGSTSSDQCLLVNYAFESTRCSSTDPASCSQVTLLYGNTGTQDPTQLRFVCTATWEPEPLAFNPPPPTGDGLAKELALTKQYWGVTSGPSTRDLDYCPGSIVVTVPEPCDPTSQTCEIVDSDFHNVTPADMSTTVPGNQIGCLLEQKETQCNVSGSPAICLQQTWGWQGDAIIRRY